MKIIEKIYDVSTNEETIIEREEDADEKVLRQKKEKQIAKEQAEAEAKVVARQAILDRLGITEEEAKLLLG
jgi:hypothetical protein